MADDIYGGMDGSLHDLSLIKGLDHSTNFVVNLNGTDSKRNDAPRVDVNAVDRSGELAPTRK